MSGSCSRYPVRSLKVRDWPPADQSDWAAACRPGGRLMRGGRASHLKPVTRADLACRYGLFLDFLSRSGRLVPDAQSGKLITPDNVAAYLAEIRNRVSSMSVHGAIVKLRRMAELLDSAWSGDWLREIEQELAWAMRPASRTHRIVDSDRIVEAGLRLMQQAEAGHDLSPGRRSNRFRDGLMIALLAVCPIRLRNFAALEIGVTLRMVRAAWIITLPASDTKSGRADERLVPAFLAARIDQYLATYRHPAEGGETRLWIGRTGQPMTYYAVERAITECTRRALGVAVNPHLFRSCAASTAYRFAGHSPGLASAVLQHSDPRTTERHYNRARSASYAGEFRDLIEKR